MKNANSTDEVQKLRQQLHHVREQSLLASRENDFRTVARLTAEAAQINRAIQTRADFADTPLRSLKVVDALAHLGAESHFVFPDEPVRPAALTLTPTFQASA